MSKSIDRWTICIALICIVFMVVSDRAMLSPWLLSSKSLTRGPLNRYHLAIIINSADPLSELIGRYYQMARGIPPTQVVRVHFPANYPDLSPGLFLDIKHYVERRIPAHVQIYALAWAAPYRVGCQSITSAFALGLDPAYCASGCSSTKLSAYHAKGVVTRPWDQLRIRPAMLLAALSFSEARLLIDRGIASDGTAPPGTAYLLSTSDSIRNVRATMYFAAVSASGPGFRVQVIKGDALVGASDVMAYFTGVSFVPSIKTNSFRPGAVADHLTSFGGQLINSPQMSSLRWLEGGATASYGTVVEPCNLPAKFPDPGLMLAYYRRGDTLIESYWRSVAMPGQGVFVGEPLARPWPRRDTETPSASIDHD